MLEFGLDLDYVFKFLNINIIFKYSIDRDGCQFHQYKPMPNLQVYYKLFLFLDQILVGAVVVPKKFGGG